MFSTFRPSPDGWFFYDETRLQDALSGGYCPVEALTGLYLLFRKRKLTAVCSHQTRIGNLDAHLI
ncbi:hypothetical protein ELT63_24990 [Escherichia coli]|nr:hypothetical protein ELT63_24990 [Escherichia coli]